MQKYSVFSLIKNAFSNHENWEIAWKDPTPKSEYDVVIIGGGGHGLATAYYLAKEHNITNVAVIEKGWIGGGNVGRNTTIIRSNYLWDQSAALYEHALKLWEGMSQELYYNVMFSQRLLRSGQAPLGVHSVCKKNSPSAPEKPCVIDAIRAANPTTRVTVEIHAPDTSPSPPRMVASWRFAILLHISTVHKAHRKIQRLSPKNRVKRTTSHIPTFTKRFG